MGLHTKQIQTPSTDVKLLHQNSPIQQAEMTHGWIDIKNRGILPQYTRSMPELPCQPYCILWKAYEEDHKYQNGITEQETAIQRTTTVGTHWH